MFNLKNSFPVLLFLSKNWTVSKIRKLSCSCSYQWNFSTDKKARVCLNFEQNARVGQISLRGFSGWLWNLLTDDTSLLTDDTSFLLFFFRELVFRLKMGWKILYQLSDSDLSAIRINLHKNPAIATVRSPMSISVSQSQSYHEFALQGVSKEGCATVQISNEQRRGADNSSNLNLWWRKEARVCKNLIWAKEEQRAVQISRCEQWKELVSANLQWWTVWAKKEARVCKSPMSIKNDFSA